MYVGDVRDRTSIYTGFDGIAEKPLFPKLFSESMNIKQVMSKNISDNNNAVNVTHVSCRRRRRCEISQ